MSMDQAVSLTATPIAGPQPILSAQGLQKRYGRVVALDNADFDLMPGEILAVIGDNGAGKTSLIKALCGAMIPDAGTIKLDGSPVHFRSPMEARLAGIETVYQNLALSPALSIADNLFLGRERSRFGVLDERAMEQVARETLARLSVRTVKSVRTPVSALSGGQRQRLALARAFLTDPAILVLDDSTSAIDSATEDRIQKAIEAAARDRTTFLITHRLSQIRWADLIIVLRSGRLEAIGNHEQLMASSPAYRRIFAQYED